MNSIRTFKRDIDSLAQVFEFTKAFAERHQLDDGIVYAMNLSVEELFTNIVRHGAKSAGDVELELGVDDGHLAITVIDADAEPFDLTASQPVDVNKGLHEREPGGLGIHIIRSIMDYVKYEYADGRAIVTLRKRLEE